MEMVAVAFPIARWHKERSKEKYPRLWEELEGESSDIPSEWLGVKFR